MLNIELHCSLMGGGASNIDDRTLIVNEVEAQQLKPTDASDIIDFDMAILEISKLRSFFHMLDLEGIKQGLGQMAAEHEPAEDDFQNTGQADKAMRGKAIVSVLKTKMAERFDSLHQSFLSIDTDKSGYISQSEFQEVRQT